MAKKDNNKRRKRNNDSESESEPESDCSTIYETLSDTDDCTESKITKSKSSRSNKHSSVKEHSTDNKKHTKNNGHTKFGKKEKMEFRDLLAKIFPSKYTKQRNASMKKMAEADKSSSEYDTEEEYVVKKTSTKKRGRKSAKNNTGSLSGSTASSALSNSDSDASELNSSIDSETLSSSASSTLSSSESERESDSNIDSDSGEHSSHRHYHTKKNKPKKKDVRKKYSEPMDEDGIYVPLSLTIGELAGQITEDVVSELTALREDDECESEDEMVYMADKYEQVEDQPTSAEQKRKQKKQKKKEMMEREMALKDVGDEYKQLLEMKKLLVGQHKQFPTNKFIKKSLKDCKESIKELIKDTRNENTKKYHKMISEEIGNEDELTYFKKKLSNKQQIEIMKQFKEINQHIGFDKPHRLSILQSSMPLKFKAIAMKKLNELKTMEGEHEYSKAKLWLDNFMRIPFGTIKSTNISMADGIDKCNDFMLGAKKTLDECVYGLDEAKMQFMQLLGQWVANPNSVGTAIGLYGAPGTGKTSIIKDGLSKILGREFAFIALGGTGDGSFLEGHSYTYEGSMWGKIVQILMDTKCMNPIIYFDELDKISDSAKGQEIIGILTHLTDTTQNTQYHDKYFADIEFDLSKCLFVFSYNDETAVNPILKDRMYKIKTKGYDTKEKIHIAKKYMLPKIREQIGFKEEDVIIDDDVLAHIISNMTMNECGVRNLKRCLETIYTKLNLFRLVKPENNLFEKHMDIKVSFPYKLTRQELGYFLKNTDPVNTTLWSMYV